MRIFTLETSISLRSEARPESQNTIAEPILRGSADELVVNPVTMR